MTPQTHRVFVYGTLKTGYGNYRAYLRGAKYAGQTTSPAKYRMLYAGFPVLIETEDDPRPAFGELFHVDDATLRALDRLEGEGSMYHRKVIDVLEHGQPVQAFVYIGGRHWCAREHDVCRINDAGAYEWHPGEYEEAI